MNASLASGAQPLIIIGAPRSGTNLLRDLLTELPGHATWACDEINPIWRHGNGGHPDDELTPDQARSEVRRYIRRRFDSLARRCEARVVVEKTCANALRVDFVQRVLPDAKFVVIERDGYDAVASALLRWRAGTNLAYTLRKGRYVPATDLPVWSWGFVTSRLGRWRGEAQALPSWGPRFAGMDVELRRGSLARVAAMQWARCVSRARAHLLTLPPERRHWIRYDKLANSRHEELAGLLAWCGVTPVADLLDRLAGTIRMDRVGHGRERLGPAVDEIQEIIDQVGAAA